jgi:hypothetical protein
MGWGKQEAVKKSQKGNFTASLWERHQFACWVETSVENPRTEESRPRGSTYLNFIFYKEGSVYYFSIVLYESK